MTLYEMLAKTDYDQRVWIFEGNAYDQHMTVYKGLVEGARTNTDGAWLYLISDVDGYYYASGILVIIVKTEGYNKRLDGWDKERGGRKWIFSCEIREDLRKEEVEYLRGGRWIAMGDKEEWYGDEYKCDKCGEKMLGKSKFCPECGARMLNAEEEG